MYMLEGKAHHLQKVLHLCQEDTMEVEALNIMEVLEEEQQILGLFLVLIMILHHYTLE